LPRARGFRRRTRRVFTRRGNNKTGLSSILRKYQLSEKVVVDIDSSQVKGMPHRRFQGRIGTIKEVGRRALTVEVPFGKKKKTVIARLEHVKPHKE